jgi:hypothetical protein
MIVQPRPSAEAGQEKVAGGAVPALPRVHIPDQAFRSGFLAAGVFEAVFSSR